VVSTNPEESLRKVLERQGYWRQEFASYDDFWKALVERGAWWDPTGLLVSRKALLKTASGKFEFYSTALRQKVEEAAGRRGSSSPADAPGDRGDRFYLPVVAIPAPVEQREFPFRLNTYRLVTRPMGGGRNQPWLLEQPAVHVRAAWERWCEVHPETAAKLGIKDGDWIWVESKKGRLRLRAKLFAGSLLDVVNIPLFGGEGPNQNDVIGNETDAFRGFGLLNTTRVNIHRG
jgi:anaerobic selenocysteine-containing dehydrogenase